MLGDDLALPVDHEGLGHTRRTERQLHGADLVVADRALEGADGIGRRGVVVIGDDFDLASVDAALGVDFVGGELSGLRDRGAGDRLGFRDDADLDRIGGEGLAAPLREAGITVVPPAEEARPVDAVFAGWFPGFTMPELEAAVHAVQDGAALYSASQTPFFATAGGRALGTSRAISAMIRSLTGCRLTVTGKPSPDALRAAAARLGVPARSVAVVGDDPLLEVPMAHRGQALAIAVDTGLGGPAAYDHLPAGRRPHLHLRGVDELAAIVRDLPPLPPPARPARRGTAARSRDTPS